MQIDYLIVGQGIAGTVLAATLLKMGSTVIVISDGQRPSASKVAAGLYNPVTGKRMNKTWKADELFPFSENFYRQFEKEYDCKIVHAMPIYKPFANIEEQNTWLSKHQAEDLIDTNIPKEKYDAFLQNDFSGFETKHSGYIDLPVFLETFRRKLISANLLIDEAFDFSKLKIMEEGIEYETISAQKIVFCEGTGVTQNPLFSWLPFVPSKGEVLKVAIEDFAKEVIFNKQVFIIPLEDQLYRVGSTYQWVFDSDQPTEKGKEELLEKLTKLIQKPFTLTEHVAGIRPSVKDRKPIIGFHPKNNSVAIFNGLGTKGVSLAPYFAKHFAEHLLNQKQLSEEVNIERFYSLYSHSES